MKTRKIVILLLVLSAALSALGYVFTNSVDFGLCVANEVVVEAVCINSYERVGDALLYGMGALAIVFLFLVFIPRAWGAWKKFAIWFIPLAALLFFFYQNPGSGNLISPYAESVFKWVGGVYVLVSLVIIAAAASKKKPVIPAK